MLKEAKAEEKERSWQIWPFKDDGDDSEAPADHYGTLADSVNVDAALVAPLPRGLSAEEASGLASVGSEAQPITILGH